MILALDKFRFKSKQNNYVSWKKLVYLILNPATVKTSTIFILIYIIYSP